MVADVIGWGRRFGGMVVAIGVVGLAGCGEKGPPRYRLEGTVTLDGAAVPAGEVLLQPDVSRGNSGPASLAKIENGSYRTEQAAGVLGGPYLLTVTGYRPEAASGGLDDGPPLQEMLVDGYRLSVELPREASRLDVTISKEEAATGNSRGGRRKGRS
ncbi:hypothetical protein Pan216_06860 [Planctomycetes bacterium Pan216]|uniref:Carboxypeptidase regulatory-like domain-containing protein n=1 Tax=Kolteria novifilia TaxID=2527975 RepID=A0A518AYQ5_9BACT|nr:hypothetical protein Pan216_06860 [Planctomycetes bacterium Pan216]